MQNGLTSDKIGKQSKLNKGSRYTIERKPSGPFNDSMLTAHWVAESLDKKAMSLHSEESTGDSPSLQSKGQQAANGVFDWDSLKRKRNQYNQMLIIE
jgi:hypothetical protein